MGPFEPLSVAANIYALIGPVGAVLVVLSVVSLAVIALKLMVFATAGLGNARAVESALGQMETGDLEGALRTVDRCRHPIGVMIRVGAGLHRDGAGRARIEARVRSLAQAQFARLGRHNRLLELIGLIAPLLGLLGTILGMIKAFRALQTSGAEADPALLAGGIWEALLTTAIGLSVAIPAIIAFNLSENRIDSLRQQASAAFGRFLANLPGRSGE